MSDSQTILRRWVEALRSGEFTQTTGQLATINPDGSKSHCCLGVLCEVAAKEGVDVVTRVRESAFTPKPVMVSYNGAEGMPPTAVIEAVGMDPDSEEGLFVVPTPAGFIWHEEETIGLTNLNDDYHFNFTQIADVIEKAYIKVEVPA